MAGETPGDRQMYRTRNIGDFAPEIDIVEKDRMGSTTRTTYRKIMDLRYGTNPHQPAAFYAPIGKDGLVLGELRELKTGKSGMSATNVQDMNNAIRILKYFEDIKACAVMKHVLPSGFAIETPERRALVDVYRTARDCDKRSAFGSIVGFNGAVDRDTADEIMETYVEGVVAPEYEDGVLDILSEPKIRKLNKNIRVVQIKNMDRLPRFYGEGSAPRNFFMMDDESFILEEGYLSKVRSKEDLKVVTERKPTEEEYTNMLLAWRLCEFVRSNGVVAAKDGRSIAIGTGKTERVGAVEDAIATAYKKVRDRAREEGMDDVERLVKNTHGDLMDAALASDGFFPYPDSIETLAPEGIKAIIQPGGSGKDDEVIAACNKYGITMVFTGSRCFAHF